MQHHVLIIEDEPAILLSVRTTLERAGYLVESAADGVEGLEKVRSSKPHLVILDILLPKLNGLDLLSTMKGDDVLRTIPVMIFSNVDRPEDVERAKSLGAVDYVLKANVSIDDISRKVAQHLAEHGKHT